jgi:hypothetical protein
MKKPALIVLICLVVLVGVAGCSSSLPSVAEVTGFTSVRFPAAGSAPSGPVTVRLAGKEASLLAQLVSQLPTVSQVQCHESLGLMYRIAFGAGSVAQVPPERSRAGDLAASGCSESP